MDQVEELEKYKELLDSGAITEEEFRRIKQKLLGLQTDEEKEAEQEAEKEAERAKALDEIEAMRAERKAKEEEARRLEQEEAAKAEAEQKARKQQEEKEKAVKAYSEEKAKEKARLDAEQEAEEERKAEKARKTQSTARTAASVFKNVVLWIVCILLFVVGIAYISTGFNIFYILSGIIALVLAAMACPLITSKTKEIPALKGYYRMKSLAVVLLIVLLLIFLMLV